MSLEHSPIYVTGTAAATVRPSDAAVDHITGLLRRGVSIVLEPAKARECPVEFSSGSKQMTAPPYAAGAFVPRGPWHAVSASELREIADPSGGENQSNTLRIVQFPAAFLHRFHELVADCDESMESIAIKAGGPAGRELLREFRQYVLSNYELNGISEGNIQGGFCVRPRDLETVSANQKTGLLVGLHVDSWFGKPLGSCGQAPIRFCGNFGWNDRFLLFLNISADQLWREFAHLVNGQASLGGGATMLARKFLTAFPDYPIGRIRLRPGEAYLVATENLAHDGSSLSSPTLDVSCHIRAG